MDVLFAKFLEKYPAAMKTLEKDREELLVFYDFPSEHVVSIKTMNMIELAFVIVKLQSCRTKNSGSRKTILLMVFKLLSPSPTPVCLEKLESAKGIYNLLCDHVWC
ncbi:MAG: transposase [Arsenophonus sp. NEOnobi-MAG3]